MKGERNLEQRLIATRELDVEAKAHHIEVAELCNNLESEGLSRLTWIAFTI